MIYNNLRLFRPVNDLIIPSKGIDNKNIALLFLPENTTFLESFASMGISHKYVRNVFVPTTKVPFTTGMRAEYRQVLLDYKMFPIRGLIGGDYSDLVGKNFYMDTSLVLDRVISRWELKRYNNGKSFNFIWGITNWIGGFPETQFERVLLYAVNLDKFVPDKITERRIYPIYYQLKQHQLGKVELPFDKILLFFYDHTGRRFTLLFDKNVNLNLGRIKKILQITQDDDPDAQEEHDIETASVEAIKNTPVEPDTTSEEKTILKNVVSNYIRDTGDTNGIKTDLLLNKAVMYHNTGDKFKSSAMSRTLSTYSHDARSKMIKKSIPTMVPKDKIKTYISNPIVAFSNPEVLNNNINPKHIFELRKREFSENLISDVKDAFNTLNKEKIPLYVKNITSKKIESGSDELYPTVKLRINVILRDNDGREHSTEIDLPYMNNDGSFTMNGMEKVLVSQLITYPIFFIKPYSGRFQSSYSTFTIHSKHLAKSSYLNIHIGGSKFPLPLLLGYKIGFTPMLKMYNIKGYEINEEKSNIKLPDGKYLHIKGELTDLQEQLIDGIVRSVKYFPRANVDLENTEYWKEALINVLGNRSSLYHVDNMWQNIVTPIEKKILDSRNDPSTIENIIKYISEEVVTGRVDDRNDIMRLRVRLSELFTAQLQKQVKSAYSEYASKRLGGDDNAQFFINPTKVLSEIAMSQNLQTLENINPVEELSMMMRVTPVGIGGPTQDAFPEKARNIHYSYFGNIDPLETPTGQPVGVQQHLTIGASLTNSRGLFSSKDRDKIKPVEILGTTSSLIPFVEHNEGARIAMATLQAKQAFPLESPENPAVQSGYESILTPLLSSSFIKKSPVDGTISEIGDNYITIKSDVGKSVTIDTSPRTLKSGQGKNGLSIFKPTVKIGNKVKEGDLLAEGSNVKNGMISNGVNLLCAFMPWKGYNFEDGMVVSESAAKKFVSLHNQEVEVLINDDEDIAYIANVGDYLKKGDILISHSSTIYDVESFINKRTDGGTIVSIEVFSNKKKEEGQEGIEHIPEKLQPIYTESVRNYIRIHGKYPEGSFKNNKEKFNGILIKFIIKQSLVLVKGDKIQNRIYNKGVVSLIVPDEEMPMTEWGDRVEIMYNPISIINRMNPGQLFELHTGLISRKLSILMGSMTRSKFIPMLQKTIQLLDNSEDKKYVKNIIGKMKTISDSQYETIKNRVVEDRFFPIIIPPFNSPSAENIMDALSVLGMKTKYPLTIPEYNKKTRPVSLGYMFIFKLEHLADKKLHARSVGPYVSGTMAPTGGKSREGGVFCGEYDLYSLIAYDADILIDEFFGPLSSDHISKNEMYSDIIRTGETSFREPKTNPVKEIFIQMMNSIHLTSD